MIVYGGFVEGAIQNDMWALNLETFAWSEVPQGEQRPPARAGHSMVLAENALWVFGGKDEENNKLNDLWRFDLAGSSWSEVQIKGDAPLVNLRRLTVFSNGVATLRASTRVRQEHLWSSSEESSRSPKVR